MTVKGCGSVTITIKAAAAGNYRAASKKIKLTAIPKQAQIIEGKWLAVGKKAYFKWKKDKSASGYQVDFAYDSRFSQGKKQEVKKNSITLSNFSIGSLKIYIRVRAYKTIGKKTYYGAWSDPRYLKK